MRAWQGKVKLPEVRQDFVALMGGMDQITPTLKLPPGFVRRGANFEASINGGYTRIWGYERFDGRPSPSAATYVALTCTLTGAVSVGDVVDGATSGASGTAVLVDGNTVVLSKVTGEFGFGEGLEVSAASVGTLDTYTTVLQDGRTDAEYRALAANLYRADIGPVPGSGPVRGVVRYNNTVYAWRDNAGGTEMVIHKSSAAGWQAVSLGHELAFTASGTTPIEEGDTVTGGTSSATGVVARVVVESGTWAGGTATGRLILSSTTGTFGAENLTVSAVALATTTGGASAITLAPGGRVVTVIENFGAQAPRVYGADGVNRGFEFDGEVYVPITTGMADDTPDLVAVLKEHLFFSFDTSLQFSSPGYPYQWSVVVGAGEIALPFVITELRVLPGDQTNGAMAVYTTSSTNILYGYSSDTFTFSPFNQSGGALKYSGADLDQPYVYSDYGVTRLKTSLDYGNFQTSSLTMNLLKFNQARAGTVTAAISNRKKSQYRVFFEDGYGLYLTIVNGKLIGAMPVQYDNPVVCICSCERNLAGDQLIYFGSDNGYVYREGNSTSFDGEAIPASLYLVFNSVKSPRTLKEYMRAVLELTGEGFAEFSVGYSLAYASPDKEQAIDVAEETDLRASYWDEFTWDNFIWDGRDIAPVETRLEGSGENIRIGITSFSDALQPFTFNTMILHYKFRRNLR